MYIPVAIMRISSVSCQLSGVNFVLKLDDFFYNKFTSTNKLVNVKVKLFSFIVIVNATFVVCFLLIVII